MDELDTLYDEPPGPGLCDRFPAVLISVSPRHFTPRSRIRSLVSQYNAFTGEISSGWDDSNLVTLALRSPLGEI